jgi:hypothetical protein
VPELEVVSMIQIVFAAVSNLADDRAMSDGSES